MSKKYRKTIPQIWVLLDDSPGGVSAIQQGIQRYAKLYGPWKLQYYIGEKELRSALMSEQEFQPPTGILARLLDRELAETLLALKIPTVFIDPPESITEKKKLIQTATRISLDTANVGSLAATYFLKHDLFHFGFVPTVPMNDWSMSHYRSFQDELRRIGRNVSLFKPAGTATRKDQVDRHLRTWLEKLPKPVALLTPSDRRGRDILDLCQEMKISVPFEVRVLSVGNDEIICDSCFPTLSSVMLHWQRGGFLAAEMLDQQLLRPMKERSFGTYDAFEIVSRDSTRHLVDATGKSLSGHVTDNHVIQALEFIRINSGFCLQVDDVAKHVGVTRQWLEKRFRAELGKTVSDEIRQLRLERIKALLVETDLPIKRIAEMSGYLDINHLRMIFKKALNMSMVEYRKWHQNHD